MGRRCRPANRGFARLLSFSKSKGGSSQKKTKEIDIDGETVTTTASPLHHHLDDTSSSSWTTEGCPYDDESCIISTTSERMDSERSASDDCLDFVRRGAGSGGSHSSKSVRFGQCNVRRYTQVMGDHPCCSMGCPLELGWAYTPAESLDIDAYECQLQHDHHLSRGEDLRLTYEERRTILMKEHKYTDSDVRRACRRFNRERCLHPSGRRQKGLMNEFFAAPPTPSPSDSL